MAKRINMVLTDNVLLSKTIAFLRFPLIVGVVFGHSKFEQVEFESYPVFGMFSYIFSNIIPYMTVPLFFLISGFLFFYKVENFTIDVYREKLRKRIQTIGIPYILWNLVVAVFVFCIQIFKSDFLFGYNKPMLEFNFQDWLCLFWNTNSISVGRHEYMPINYPLWFLRDLIVAVLFSPLVYIIAKKLRKYIFILLALVVIRADCISSFIGENSLSTLIFFSAGAYLGIFKQNFAVMLKSEPVYFAIIYSVFVLIEYCFRNELWVRYWHLCGVIIGVCLTVSLCAHFIERGYWKSNTFLTKSSFFIYAYHAIPLSYVTGCVLKWLNPHSEAIFIMLYLMIPTFIIVVGLGVYWLLQRYLPEFTSVITGGR